MPLDNAVLDFHTLGIEDSGSGPKQRAVVVAARRDMIERVVRAVRDAGLRLEGIDLAAFAMVRALHHPAPEAEDSAGDLPGQVLYVWLGGITNLAVAQGTTCVFTRASGGGLETMAVELAERRQLTLVHARQWLEHVGLEVPLVDIEGDTDIVEEAREVLQDGVRRVANEIRGSLDFQSAYGGSGAVSRVILTGPATAVPGFANALEGALALPVHAMSVEHAPEGVDARRITVAAGLALEEPLS
jgi:type IV pilus assembly protein PilM